MLRQRTEQRLRQGKSTAPVEQNALAYLEQQQKARNGLPESATSEEVEHAQTPDQIESFFKAVRSAADRYPRCLAIPGHRWSTLTSLMKR